MLAPCEARPLVEQLSDTYKFTRPLPVLSSYSGFAPNPVFNTCSPSEVMVYATIQYLSFFSIKCSTSNIAKNLNASDSTIKNARNSLSKKSFISRQQDGTYLFKNFNPGRPNELVDAKELVSLHLGYWLPVETLKSKKITNQEKKAFALIKSLTNEKEMKIDMNYISEKLKLSRRAASPLINRLLDENLISRDRPHCRSAFIYQTRGQNMSVYKNELSTEGCLNFKQSTQNDTSKGTQNFPSLSINESNKYFIDSSKDKRASTTYESGQKESFFVLKETIDYLLDKIRRFEESPESQEEDIGSLNAKYTQACIDCDLDKIQELRAKMATHDIRENKTGQSRGDSVRAKGILSDHEYCLKKERHMNLSDDQIKKIGTSAKEKVDLDEYASPKIRKMAFCLTFNSLTLDLKEQHAKSPNMDAAVEICLKWLERDRYELNSAIDPKMAPQGMNRQTNQPIKPSNENYSNSWDWLNK